MITGVLETCLYARDLDSAARFYAEVLELREIARAEGRHVFFRCGGGVLLLFNPDVTGATPGAVGGTPVPAHGTAGPGHVAFAVPEASLAGWRDRLTARGVAIEAEIAWPRGGRSLYVRDPAGNSVELAPGGIWGIEE